MTKNALEVQNLVKSYRGKPAVRDISFSARFSEITAVLGPNGAGKTTTIECCEGLRAPDFGQIEILGTNPRSAPAQIRERIGVMLQDGGLPMAVPAGVVLRHIARLYGAATRRTEELIERLELGSHLKTPVRRLSGGNRQRLALACALQSDPDVLFLDEPTAGMDAHARLAVHNLIEQIRESGTAIILTTHLLDEAEALADRVILMANGKIEADGTLEQVTRNGRETRAGIELVLAAAATREILQAGLDSRYEVTDSPGGATRTPGRAWHISPAPDPRAFAALATHLAHLDIGISEVGSRTDLTSLFLELASGDENK